MSVYPDLLAGQRLTGTRLRAMVPNIVDKMIATDRASNATSTADPELSGITLTPGRYLIKTLLMFAGTPGFKNRWAFSGTQLGGNRAIIGQGTSTSPTAVVSMINSAAPFTTEQTYANASNSAYSRIEETGIMTVTVTGTFAIEWAQPASNVTPSSLKIGSYVEIKQIAA